MALGDFFQSPFFKFLVIVIIIYFVLEVIGRRLFGKPIGMVIAEAWGHRPVKLEDIDAQAHPRIVKESKDACKLSVEYNPTWLCLRSIDNVHYTTQQGIKTLGRIRGMATYRSHIEVLFRKGWTFKRWIFIAPPDLLLSPLSAKNILFEGISVKVIGSDFCYPIPSIYSRSWTEDRIDKFAMRIYETKITQASNVMLNQLGETLLLKSGSDKVETKTQREMLRRHIFRTEAPPNEPQQKQDDLFF